jgi:hypothetical protein
MRLRDRFRRCWIKAPRVVEVKKGRIVIEARGCRIEIEEGDVSDKRGRETTTIHVVPNRDSSEGVFRLIEKRKHNIRGVLAVVKLKRPHKPVTMKDIEETSAAGNRAVEEAGS